MTLDLFGLVELLNGFWFINTICSLAYTSSAVMNTGIYAGKFPLAFTKTASVAQWNYGAS